VKTIKKTINSPSDTIDLLIPIAKKKQEHFMVICLNEACEIISKKVLFIGSDDACSFNIRNIAWYLCKKQARVFIVAHNHPSGDVTPSSADIESTKAIQEAGKLLGIQLLDHVIIGRDSYHSMLEHNELTDDSSKDRRLIACLR